MSSTPSIATIGMFDGVHRGHIALFERLRSEADRLGMQPCVVTFGHHPLSLIDPAKAPAMLMTPDDKAAAIRHCGIDRVIMLDFDSNLRALTAAGFMTLLRDRYGVKALLMGFNHRFGSDRIGSFSAYREIGRQLGIEVILADEMRDQSEPDARICSSAIRSAIAAGDIKSAAKMLGRRYSIAGKIMAGKQLGRTIGFPTANIELIDNEMLLPANGVYAVDVAMPDCSVTRGMLNIGVRPTVDTSADPKPSVEVHIIGWNGDLYGQRLRVEFISRLRDERRFDSIDALKSQLGDDLRNAMDAR